MTIRVMKVFYNHDTSDEGERYQFVLEVDVAAVLPASGEQLCEVHAASAQDAAVGGEPLAVHGKRHIRVFRTLQHPATRENNTSTGRSRES